MRDQWFSDNRDLVKWSVLFHLAKQSQADYILQIAYYRRSKYGKIKIDNKEIEIPAEVLSFFRNISNIQQVNSKIKVSVFDRKFDDRIDYEKTVIDFINNYSGSRCVLFLDPDTGLEPAKPDLKHVLSSEARSLFQAIKPDDVFVFYQHKTNRNGQPWIEPKKVQLAASLVVENSEIKIAHSPKIAHDVVFYYIKKKA